MRLGLLCCAAVQHCRVVGRGRDRAAREGRTTSELWEEKNSYWAAVKLALAAFYTFARSRLLIHSYTGPCFLYSDIHVSRQMVYVKKAISPFKLKKSTQNEYYTDHVLNPTTFLTEICRKKSHYLLLFLCWKRAEEAEVNLMCSACSTK